VIYTIHIGQRDHTGWLPQVAYEETRALASARARELLAQMPFFGAEIRCRRRLIECYVKRHPDDTGVGLPARRRLYFDGIRRLYAAPTPRNGSTPAVEGMTDVQRTALQAACNRYGAPFHERDYHHAFELRPGWVAGWVVGVLGTNVYVSCSPEGELTS